MKHRLISSVILLVTASTLAFFTVATDKPHKKMRDAAKTTSDREQEILAKSQSNDWEAQQLEKARAQSDERLTRQQKYLQQAQEAATQTRKIPKDTSIEPVQSD